MREGTTHLIGPQRIYRQGWEKQPGNGAGRTFPKFDDGVPWGKKGSNTLALIDQINQRLDTYRTLANNLSVSGEERKETIGPPCKYPIKTWNRGAVLSRKKVRCWEELCACFMALKVKNAFCLGSSFREVERGAARDPGRRRHGARYLDQATP